MRFNINRGCVFGLAVALMLPALLAADSGSAVTNPLRGRVANFSSVGNRAAEFLSIPVGARAISMGSAFIAQADDISAIYWNPAGLSFIEGPQAFFNHVDMPLDFSLDYTAGAMPFFDNRLVLGGFFGILNIAPEEITTIDSPDGTGAYYDGYSLQFGGSIAYNFSDRFSAGLNIKGVRESIYQLSGNAVAFDMGTNYHTELFEKPIRVSFVISNLGSNIRLLGENLFVQVRPQELYSDRLSDGAGNRIFSRDNRNAYYSTSRFSLPTSFMAGMSMDLYSSNDSRFTVAGQFAENNYMPTSYAMGTEFTRKISSRFSGALRWGWCVERDEVDLTGNEQMRGMSAGGGMEFRLYKDISLLVDYAYRDWGRLTQNQVFTLSWKMM